MKRIGGWLATACARAIVLAIALVVLALELGALFLLVWLAHEGFLRAVGAR